MINVICVKWGTKYNSNHVNRLFKMVEKNLSLPFLFYCLTDDPKEINKNINIIPIKHDLEVWWNKLAMFEKGFGGLNGRCLFFDLDIIIQNNIDDIALYKHDGLCKIFAHWKSENVFVNNYFLDMRNNSSCLTWEADSLDFIWEHFCADIDHYLFKYKGIDRFIYWEENLNSHVTTFPKEWFYSRVQGDGETDGQILTNKYRNKKRIYLFERPEKKVCLLNGFSKYFTEDEVLEGLDVYYR